MSPEREAAIFDRWPGWFVSKGDISRSLMGFGFQCEDGWFHLIFKLFDEIETLAAALNPTEWPIEIEQVKQKYGGLRIAASGTNDAIDAAIMAAEKQSLQTCEKCGGPGSLSRDVRGWFQTLCDACRSSAADPSLPTGL
jgi:hypothetical protein